MRHSQSFSASWVMINYPDSGCRNQTTAIYIQSLHGSKYILNPEPQCQEFLMPEVGSWSMLINYRQDSGIEDV